PLIRFYPDNFDGEIYLKLENLQPIGSFKLRGAINAMALAPPAELARGVWTPSAGNMAQGVAWQARRLGIPCHVVAPDHAPATKLEAVRRLGARVTTVPFAEWFEILATRRFRDLQGVFIHPVADPGVMAGNATIALEILEDLPEVNQILVPYGGGGLGCGIAAVVRSLAPRARVLACEVETAAPLAASLRAGQPTRIEYRASFVDGMGSPFILDEMWPLASTLLAGSLVVSLDQVADAIRRLAERQRVIAEGAGAAPVAAVLAGLAGEGRTVCVISGGNLDSHHLREILGGRTPAGGPMTRD
ncbi:MAG: threonine ammonia-lyase, partial [Candidatus Eiseniibacteriota bacterium]